MLLVASFVAHSNVLYRILYFAPCIEIRIVSWENVSLQAHLN